MSESGTPRDDWITRFGAWRGSRRQTGVLAAALLALLTAPEPAGGRKTSKRRAVQHGQRQRADGALRRRRTCGGLIGKPCPRGYTCVDDPRDDCDPANGGADCSGICVRKRRNPCATIRCAAGTVCCPKCGGLCIPDGIPCTDELCDGEPCNQTTCAVGEYCCNAACSHCVPYGRHCLDDLCPQPVGEPCGRKRCGPEEYCCNASCGICASFGESCTQSICDPYDPPREECGRTVCPPGQVCCNASCGICTPPGMACIMIACEDPPVE